MVTKLSNARLRPTLKLWADGTYKPKGGFHLSNCVSRSDLWRIWKPWTRLQGWMTNLSFPCPHTFYRTVESCWSPTWLYFPSLTSFCLLRNQSGILYWRGFCMMVTTRSTWRQKTLFTKCSNSSCLTVEAVKVVPTVECVPVKAWRLCDSDEVGKQS